MARSCEVAQWLVICFERSLAGALNSFGRHGLSRALVSAPKAVRLYVLVGREGSNAGRRSEGRPRVRHSCRPTHSASAPVCSDSVTPPAAQAPPRPECRRGLSRSADPPPRTVLPLANGPIRRRRCSPGKPQVRERSKSPVMNDSRITAIFGHGFVHSGRFGTWGRAPPAPRRRRHRPALAPHPRTTVVFFRAIGDRSKNRLPACPSWAIMERVRLGIPEVPGRVLQGKGDLYE